MEDSPDYHGEATRQEQMPQGGTSYEPDSPVDADPEAGRAQIPDDCLVTVELRGYGTGVIRLEAGVLDVLHGRYRDMTWWEQFAHTMDRLSCVIRVAGNPPSEHDERGDLLYSIDLALSEEHMEEEDPPFPALSGTGGILRQGVSYLLHGITARYGDVLEMGMTKTSVTIGNRIIGLEEFDLEIDDGEWDVEEWFIAGVRLSDPECVHDLDLIAALADDIDYILRYSQSHQYRTSAEVFEDNPFWYGALLQVVAAMPSERRKHIICYQNKLAEALRNAFRSGWIPEPAP